MRLKEIISKDYFKLFVRREGKVVLGKRYSNLWLLCSVLFVTFLAIAFSNASLKYLEFKMNDPFINWVDITNQSEADFSGFQRDLHSSKLKEQFGYKGFQSDKSAYITFCTAPVGMSIDDKEGTQNLDGRYFEEINTPLVQKILEKDNVIGEYCIDQSLLDNQSFGVIITEDAIRNKLRYKQIPAYINYYEFCDASAAEMFDVELLAGKFARVPVPVLAVVKRLPNSKDYIGTKFYLRENRLHRSMNLVNEKYHKSLLYFVPETVDVDTFVTKLNTLTSENTSAMSYSMQGEDNHKPRLNSFVKGGFVSLSFYYDDEVDYMANSKINKAMLAEYASQGVYRVYDYNEHSGNQEITDDYISVHFEYLDHIADFQQFAKDEYRIDIDMSQINAKDNFNAVSIMANILSWTMIVFAIVCIILFIVNLLQSYFQKVKRNLGTFKAFGISNSELISVYVLIMLATIVAAIVLSIGCAWLVELLMWIVGIEKDSGFGYLSLWSGKTFASIIIIIAASIYTVYVVMRNLLKDTPGDLIYDR